MMNQEQPERVDYGSMGITIQDAQVREYYRLLKGKRRLAKKDRKPSPILWNGADVWTVYDLAVPRRGHFSLEFLTKPSAPLRGVDVDIQDGGVSMKTGELLPTLRTWNDRNFEQEVTYEYRSRRGLIKVWNVFQHRWPDGSLTDEKWLDNAGFLVAQSSHTQWTFSCSRDVDEPPDFRDFVFRFSVRPIDA